jgi:hypothetical protein
MFGQVPHLTWAGGDTYTTVWGAFISILIKLAIWAYFIFRIVLFAQRVGPAYTTATLRITPENDGPFLPRDTGFTFAFGLSRPLDPSIGFFNISLNYNLANSNGTRDKSSQALKVAPCTQDNFKLDSKLTGLASLYSNY